MFRSVLHSSIQSYADDTLLTYYFNPSHIVNVNVKVICDLQLLYI